MVLATKGGISMGVPYDSSPSYLAQAIDASLTRMGVERVELYQIHRPDMLTHPQEVARALEDAHRAGKIAAIGVSNHTPAQTEALAAFLTVPLASHQPEFSALVTKPLFDGTPRPGDGARHGGARLVAARRWAHRRPQGRARHAVAALLDAKAAETGVARTAAAYSWIMAHPARPIPIVGTQNPKRIAEIGDAMKPQWTRADWYRVLEASMGRRSAVMSERECEVSWFSALCDDDYEFLGVPDPKLKSSWEHCRDIVLQAESGGFDNILLPSGYSLGIDTTAFAAAIAPMLRRMALLMAVRDRRGWPPQLARQIATIDRLLGGRLTINIISSDLPGEVLASGPRYRRTVEAMHILKTMLNGESLDHDGEFWKLKLDPPRIGTVSGKAPPLYFGGLSEDAREAAAKGCDVFLMWPDKAETIAAIIADMTARAARYGRTLRFGYRAHVVVRDTEAEARAAADRLLSKLDAGKGAAIRAKSLDSTSTGVAAQAALRESAADDGYAEANLWTGIGRARSGCGAAIVGDPDQVLAKLESYRAMGIEAFILSGYPHAAEADLFARHVLPKLDHGPLSRTG